MFGQLLTQVWCSAIVWIQDMWRQEEIGLKDKTRCGAGVQVGSWCLDGQRDKDVILDNHIVNSQSSKISVSFNPLSCGSNGTIEL